MKTRVLVLLAALVVCIAIVAPASAAVTGNFSGETSQDLGLDEPYTTDIVFSILNGRMVTVVAEVRMQCGPAEIRDVRVLKSYKTGRGPQLSGGGGFAFTVQGAHISGSIGKKAGSGTISASKGGCSGDGKWKVSYVKGT